MNEKNQKEFVISREFNASRDFMFKVWTDPEHMQRWWGPKDFKVDVQQNGFPPGWQLSLLHAFPRRQRHVGQVRLSRNREARAYRLRQFLFRRERRH